MNVYLYAYVHEDHEFMALPSSTSSYSTIAWGASAQKGKQAHVDYGLKATTVPGTIFNVLSALGDVAFAYAGHNVVLEIQATIPSTPEKPSKKPMWKGVIFAYITVAICYFPVALVGYWAFGNNVADNVLISLEKPRWLIALANMFVVIHVIGSYQVLIFVCISLKKAFSITIQYHIHGKLSLTFCILIPSVKTDLCNACV